MKNETDAVLSAHTVTGWTPERQRRALRLYLHEGLTASEVAEALGGALTRCAVISKVRRLGFFKRQARPAGLAAAPCGVQSSRARVDRRLPPQRPPIPLPPLNEAAATGIPRRLADLAADACRWPIDDPGPGRMHLALFCAGVVEAGPYCAAHRAIARRERTLPDRRP